MAKLILSMDGLVLKEFPLRKERTTIGRKPHNDSQIDNLTVSGEHAVIVTIRHDSFLEDLRRTHRTPIDGNPIKKHFMQNNDVVELGKYTLKFVGEAAPAAAGPDKADFEKTMVLRPSAVKAAAAAGGAAGGGAQAAVAARAEAVKQAAASAAATGIADKDAKPAAPAAAAPAANPGATTPVAAPAAAPAAPPPRAGQPLGAIQ